jgi:hypothetical protein
MDASPTVNDRDYRLGLHRAQTVAHMRLRLDQRVTDRESVAKHVIHGAAHGRHAGAHGGREGKEIVLPADCDYMVHVKPSLGF